MRLILTLLAALLCIAPAAAQNRAAPGMVRVRIVTGMGPIVVALDARHAPKTTANFLAYVDDGRLDGTIFYRASRNKSDPHHGFIQGGVQTDYRRILPSPPLEPTNMTRIHHLDGTISMARGVLENSATGNFSLMVGPNPGLDARGPDKGYAAFGHVVAGMDVVKRILALPSGGGSGAMLGQMILKPVPIVKVERIDGTAKPTGLPKPWLIGRR